MYKKIFLAELDHLYEMLDFIKNFKWNGNLIPSPALNQIILASEEALVNIIEYSYPNEEKGMIEISCENYQQQAGITIIIKDQGIPFNPIQKVPSLSAIRQTDALGGYGIYLFLELMDCVEYQRLNQENVLSLTKYLSF